MLTRSMASRREENAENTEQANSESIQSAILDMKTLLCSHIERVQEIDKKVDALSSVLSERCGELERRQLEMEREFYTKIQALEAQISDRSEEWKDLLAQDHAKLMTISHGAIKHELK
ncbi:predicted protein [Nematostella vectensis]|uniref:Uncharacterized protein n=1 Tax=Nematostella vectensis TaxID=45351 RepID=A7T4N8_NEMVE|nr:predicted protein [Nematostella vectensis]|eukprot:XP_001621176.1 hypothetical protein NEMVEDRAFT_v1g248716 [Nematostella vectensis]